MLSETSTQECQGSTIQLRRNRKIQSYMKEERKLLLGTM